MKKDNVPADAGDPAAGPAVPDPVVTLFAEWGAFNEELMAIYEAVPEGAGEGTVAPIAKEDELWSAAFNRRDAVERQIMETHATSIKGVAVKLRIATHRNSDKADLPRLYATPAQEIDYEKECGTVDWKMDPIISALRDAERLAGAS